VKRQQQYTSMKLWSKDDTNTSKLIEQFTVGRDREFDLLLAEHDVTGSIAHVTMLGKVGLMSETETNEALNGLNEILATIRSKEFRIQDGVEDIHSQVEILLTEKIGEAGKKIHSGRSRNDQVLVDIKLFLRAEILAVKDEMSRLFELLIRQSEKYKSVLLPGYTHFQVAMPSSFGLWFGAYAESLIDDLELLAAAYSVANKNPLGSGAGFGSSFPLDRTMTTKLLKFRTMNHNSVYAQMTRGRTEKALAFAFSSVAATLNKLASDCCLYLSQNFGFISFPAEFTTGSSIMPHKKNPDVFELIRARTNRLQSVPNEITLMLTNLPSGYHRDLQLVKETIFPAIESVRSCIAMTILMIENIEVSDNLLSDDRYRYIFSVEAVNALVNKGVPFREAYRQVGNQIAENKFSFSSADMLKHTHEGSMGNLMNEAIVQEFERVSRKFEV
jgi:argininosuccinate lyase